jgi:hypothetical protein
VTWEHRLGEPVPARLPLEDGAADQVLLEGSFNGDLPEAELAHLLAEAGRVLRSGGRIRMHGLVADRPLATPPQLPGPAAAVRHVPELGVPLQSLSAAGFVGLYLEKLSPAGHFRHEGTALRELVLTGTKSQPSLFELCQQVVYQGPLAAVTDDRGHCLRRGEPTSLANADAEVLRSGPAAGQFTFLAPGVELPQPGCGAGEG